MRVVAAEVRGLMFERSTEFIYFENLRNSSLYSLTKRVIFCIKNNFCEPNE
ncbi:hypothetical protein Hanom_Chr16g01416111 [Helianthus anomalus]